MEVYLDNAATTKVFDQVGDSIRESMCSQYGNPSSKHQKGMDGEMAVRKATESIAKSLKCKPKEIIYTSGGTESNNMAIFGIAQAHNRRGKHVITTNMEHPSIHEPLFELERQGYEVTYLGVDETGQVSQEELSLALRPDTILVSIMYVNNEIGAINQIKELAQIVHQYDSQIIFHVDAIQAYGKFKIIPKQLGIQLMSVSGHKIHGPKGVGFLYVEEGTKIKPFLLGGGQQKGMRSGTENVPGIVGLGMAATRCHQDMDAQINGMRELQQFFIEQLASLDGVVIHGKEVNRAPHIVSAGFEGIKSEVLLHALEEKEIYVSSGSACASNHPGISGTLQAIGVKKEFLDATLRFSFSYETTKDQLEYTIEQIKILLPMLRRFRRH